MFDDPDDDTAVIFRDTLFLALLGFVAVVVILISHINPKAQASTKDAEPPGNVIVEVRWPDQLDADVDLWILGPDGGKVGYSAKSSRLFNLLRDDLGHTLDVSGLNYEIAYSRGIMAGEYIADLHLYRNLSGVGDIPCKVVVSVRAQNDKPAVQIAVSDVVLTREGQELTAIRFRLDADGRLVPGSVNKVFKAVRAA